MSIYFLVGKKSNIEFKFLIIYRFDWSGKTPIIFDRRVVIEEKAIESGMAHAAFMWWDLQMDFEGKVSIFI